MNDLLGICIPTYKRPQQLAACVQSVITAAQPHAAPIFIADDAVDDTNVATVEQLRRRYPHIRYHRNATNLGIDRNILNVANLCDCRYAWLLGEDDRLVPEAVGEVLRELRREPTFVFVNYSTVNEGVTAVLREKALSIAADEERSAEEFLADTGWSIGFIGACVVNKALWHTAPQAPYIGTYFAHVGVIFHYLQGRRLSLIAKPLVLNRCGTPQTFTWRQETFEVLGGWARLMTCLRPIYGDVVCAQSLEAFERSHGLGTLRFLLYARAGGVYDEKAYCEHVRDSNRSRAHKLGAWLIAKSDRRLTHAMYLLLAGIRQRTRRQISGY